MAAGLGGQAAAEPSLLLSIVWAPGTPLSGRHGSRWAGLLKIAKLQLNSDADRVPASLRARTRMTVRQNRARRCLGLRSSQLVVAVLLTSCGGSPSAAKQLAEARAASNCSTILGDHACAYYNRIDHWIRTGAIDEKNAGGAIALVQGGCVNCHTNRNIGGQELARPISRTSAARRTSSSSER